jgi:trehalose utilization protein
MCKKVNVTVWNETDGAIGPYSEGIHNAVAGFLREKNIFGEVRTATLPQAEHGLTDDVLNDTDVLIWWGHSYHHLVDDGVVYRVQQRVYGGMGLIVLHSGHASKVFQRLMGMETWKLRWRDVGELERVWTIDHSHPITAGLPEHFEIPQTEMYGECFRIPAPDELVFVSWYEGGEVFRSGCTFKRGLGKVFFFSPGHEQYPIYYQPEVQTVIANAALWAAGTNNPVPVSDHTPAPLTEIKKRT